jgi:RNA-directed DNA polymerase
MHLKHSFTSEAELKEKLDFIYSQSKKGKNFHGIMEVAFNEVTIITAIHNIKSNKGANTPGVDNNKIDKYLQMEKNELIQLIQKQVAEYKPRPVKRVYIKKSNGKLRPLGIPTILERIIQECIKIVIEPIVEAKFFPNSYGFRPYRATKHAVMDITNKINVNSKTKPIYIIEGDIKSFFDNINHRILLKKLWKMGVHDKRILAILKKMLEAGYLDGNTLYTTEIGTVQGGVISPLLANVYLNDFDWTVGKMYQYPERSCKRVEDDRTRLRNRGVIPKYLVRYADDWTLQTTTESEANRILKYLNKYFRHKLKLELSSEKTVITNIAEKPIKFLGFMAKAEKARSTPKNPKPTNIVGKAFSDMNRVKTKTREILKEIKQLKYMGSNQRKAAQIEKINSMIIGVAEYNKTFICSKAFNYVDYRVRETTYYTFKSMYQKQYKKYRITLENLTNRPQRHKGYKSKTYAIKIGEMNIGITKAFITHSQWIRRPYNQKTTPYTEEGRELYLRQTNKKLPLNRPLLYDIEELNQCKEDKVNFEFYMNREYAYNRDGGKCKICREELVESNRHCHWINENKPLNKINKVANLAWFCKRCDRYIHSEEKPKGIDNGEIKKIRKYRSKLELKI